MFAFEGLAEAAKAAERERPRSSAERVPEKMNRISEKLLFDIKLHLAYNSLVFAMPTIRQLIKNPRKPLATKS